MRPFRVFRIVCALVCLTAPTALAQYTLKKIVFDGTTEELVTSTDPWLKDYLS